MGVGIYRVIKWEGGIEDELDYKAPLLAVVLGVVLHIRERVRGEGYILTVMNSIQCCKPGTRLTPKLD